MFSFGRDKTVDELQQEKERNDLQITIAQQNRIKAQLKEHGLTLKSFAGSLKSAIAWLKSH
jgi:hypothetical protein